MAPAVMVPFFALRASQGKQGSRVQGSKVQGFKGSRFKGSGVQGSKVQGSGFRVQKL